MIAPFWDDLTTTGKNGSDVYVDVIGDAPNRKLVVEWWRVRHYRSRGLGAFQVVFYENSPDVRFNYLDTYLSHRSYNYGRSATIGLQTSKESALEYSHNKRSVASKSSLLFKLE